MINIQRLLSFYFYKEKERLTGKDVLEWSFHGNLCRTIGPLLSQRFPLASAKAQPKGGFLTSWMQIALILLILVPHCSILYQNTPNISSFKDEGKIVLGDPPGSTFPKCPNYPPDGPKQGLFAISLHKSFFFSVNVWE